MNKVKNSYLLFSFALLLLSPKVVNSQVICSPDLIYGDWYYIRAFDPVDKINVDSLKSLVKDTSQVLYKLTFLEDGKCISKTKAKKDRIGVYKIDSLNCKIIFGKRKKPRYSAIGTIEYLDGNCLFYTKWNPHGPVTFFYYRK